MRKVFLRLDDGSLIGRAEAFGRADGGEQVVRLPVEQLVEMGRATDKEVTRLQAILTRIRQQFPAPPKSTLQKQQSARVDAGLPGQQGPPWMSKCRELLTKLYKHLGPHKDVFYLPVSPQVLPDYYSVIKQPLFLVDIEKRLKEGQYQQPQDFFNDMHHHFANVKLYNPQHDPFRKIGDKAEEYFEQQWAGLGLGAGERNKRATAGLAALKFDPEHFEAPAKPRPARSNQPAGSKRSRDGVPRTLSMSHEVESMGHSHAHATQHHPHAGLGALQGVPVLPATHPAMGAPVPHGDEPGRVSQQRIQEMGAYLARDDLPEEYGNHLLTLLPPHMMAGLESGELELDFEVLDNDTLLRIDAWLRTLPGAPNSAAAGGGYGGMPPPQQQQQAQQQQQWVSPQPQPSVRVDSFDDDEDYEEESDDSD